MEAKLDSPRPPRSGEELDTAALGRYLGEHLPAAAGREIVVEQFPSGYSNLTYLLRVGDLELVLRRPPFGNRVKSAHDMGREYRVLERLHRVYTPAPRPYLYCADETVIGAPFYLMERRRGIILRRQPPPGLKLEPALMERLSASFVDQLAKLHNLDWEAAGLADLGRPEGYVERQVSGWIKRYEKARTDDWPELEELAAWLRENRPGATGSAVVPSAQVPSAQVPSAQVPSALVHNDYKYDNLVLDPADPARVVALLDWEMCTIGDPLLDLGNALAYWVEAEDPPEWRAAAFGPTHLPGSYSRRQVAERYAEKTGLDVSGMAFYYAFGLYRLAVIAQQIYARYVRGSTRDERFAEMSQTVGLIGRLGATVAEGGDL